MSVKQGKLKGKSGIDYEGKTFYSFQGILYARPPIGKLRFKVMHDTQLHTLRTIKIVGPSTCRSLGRRKRCHQRRQFVLPALNHYWFDRRKRRLPIFECLHSSSKI